MTSLGGTTSYTKSIQDSGPASLIMAQGADGAPPTGFSFFSENDFFIQQIKIPTISDVTFEVDGIPLHACNVPDPSAAKLVIWGVLGYMPYSIHSVPKRRALIQILESSHRLPKVKFGVDPSMKIVVTGTYDVDTPPNPNYIFEPIINFIQEARPFIKLIADYL